VVTGGGVLVVVGLTDVDEVVGLTEVLEVVGLTEVLEVVGLTVVAVEVGGLTEELIPVPVKVVPMSPYLMFE